VKVCFQVQDTGIGISPENLESIFEVADPGGGLFPQRGKGHGLGLHLCRRIACLMGGDLYAESEPGKGSCFYFTIALSRAEKQQALRPSSVALEEKTVFILDFEKIHMSILSRLCRQAGMNVITCGSINTISSQLEDLIINKTKIDLFIIDVSTVADDIGDIIELIRENFGLIPLLAFTSPNRGSAKACQGMGFNGCLSKPCSKLPLYEIMKHLLAEDFDAEGRREILTRYSLSEEIKHNLHILVVDDNHVNQMVALRILTQSGYAVDSAANGLEATNTVLADPGRYDVILMDVHMPVMNGLEAVKLLRKNHIEVPIIAYTSNTRENDIETYLKAGMNDCIPKPLNREIILEKLYHLCFRPESRVFVEHEAGHC
jgi:CheY-like chemotaxis protein